MDDDKEDKFPDGWLKFLQLVLVIKLILILSVWDEGTPGSSESNLSILQEEIPKSEQQISEQQHHTRS